MKDDKPPGEHDSNRDQNEAKVARFWFNQLDNGKQIDIIKPAYRNEHPETKDQITARKLYEAATGEKLVERRGDKG